MNLELSSYSINAKPKYTSDLIMSGLNGFTCCSKIIETNFLFLFSFQVFFEHSIDGSALLVLNESHLTRIMGLKLGPAIRLRNAIQELKNITNCD